MEDNGHPDQSIWGESSLHQTRGAPVPGGRCSRARSRWRAPRRSPGPSAGPVVLRLVDCSLLVPPRAGPDGRSRYVMLETLRAYGAGLLAEAGEADAALAGCALRVAGQAAAGLQTTTGEAPAACWLDAEDAAMRQALAWAMEHDLGVALLPRIETCPASNVDHLRHVVIFK